MPKVWNKRDKKCPKDAVYVGRPSIWGNPYEIGKPIYIDSVPTLKATRQEVIEAYRIWLNCRIADGSLYPPVLKGKDLICWCAPLPCHADVLLELANKE
jgi:hypothetical protein